jgi:hypothetical protein
VSFSVQCAASISLGLSVKGEIAVQSFTSWRPQRACQLGPRLLASALYILKMVTSTFMGCDLFIAQSTTSSSNQH